MKLGLRLKLGCDNYGIMNSGTWVKQILGQETDNTLQEVSTLKLV